MRKLVVTGGHYTPAAAVMAELESRGDWEIFYVGKMHSFEGDKAVSYEYLELKNQPSIHFLNITAGRLQPRFLEEHVVQSFVALAKIPVGFLQSFWWLVRYQPAGVLSFGGYIALPVVVCAWLLGIPVVTHEQTKVFGLANRGIQVFANKICVSFKSSMPEKDSDRWLFTGNPIRKDTLKVKETPELKNFHQVKNLTKRLVLYVTGGKQGSHAINAEILRILPELVKTYMLIIQTGDNRQFDDYGKLCTLVNFLPEDQRKFVQVVKFVGSSEIGAVFSLADIVISRSGANTIFDLALVGKPGILIPLPSSRGGEQVLNAQELESRGVAEILDQKNLSQLETTIARMAKNLPTLRKKASAASDLIVPDSAQRIAEIVIASAR